MHVYRHTHGSSIWPVFQWFMLKCQCLQDICKPYQEITDCQPRHTHSFLQQVKAISAVSRNEREVS